MMDTVTDFALPLELLPESQPQAGGLTVTWRSEPRRRPSCTQGTETCSVATSSIEFISVPQGALRAM